LDEVDESETGSANLWSGPRKGAGRFSGPCLEERLVSPRGLWLLEEEDDEEEENG
jgi:hypothetical protein